MTNKDWIAEELATADLGDKRRKRRAMATIADMAARPQGSVLQFSETMAQAKGTYRLLSPQSERAQEHDLATGVRAGLADACARRMAAADVVLAIQDTTSFDFHTHRATTGLGPLGGGHDGQSGQGFFLHTTLAVSAAGVPLGVLWQKSWVRDHAVAQSRKRHEVPLEDRESYRWVQSQAAVHHRLAAATTVITVADREAACFELFATARPQRAHLLIRATGRRLVGAGETRELLSEVIAHAPVLGEYEVTIRRHPEHRPRAVRLVIQAMTVTLPVPKSNRRSAAHDQPVRLSAIYVTEAVPRAGMAKIEWLLLTDLPVPDLATAQRYVQYYSLRWLIERYHYTLKSGCRIQASQLHTHEALQNLLALYCAVAWRLLWLTYAARQDEQQACTVAFSDLEWLTLHCLYQAGEARPVDPPPLRTVVRWLGRLGGHPGRKGDGEPGVKVLWIGMTRLTDIITGLQLAEALKDVGKA